MIFELKGLFISVRKPEILDIPILSGWLASDVFCENLGGVAGMPNSYYEEFAYKLLESNANDLSTRTCYLISDRFTKLPIGLSILSRIDWKNRHAEHCYIIGDEGHRSKFIAADLNMIMNNYFFYQLNINKIYSYIFEDNKASIRLTAFGAKFDGTLVRHRKHHTKTFDVHIYSLTKSEFKEFVCEHAEGLLRKYFNHGLISCIGG